MRIAVIRIVGLVLFPICGIIINSPYKHPVSGLAFEGMSHPGYGKMVETAFAIHSGIHEYNLLSFDLVQRKDGSICVVEINATSQGITQLQYDFGGLFGEHTEQVVNWCAAHKELDTFEHIRTWY